MRANIALFTRDLRVHDNPVLTAAQDAGEPVVPLFVLDDGILARAATPNRVRFLLAALTELDADLRALGARLVVRRGDTAAETARVAEETGARGVHIAADVSGYSVRRAERLRAKLSRLDCALHVHGGSVTAVDPGALRPSGGGDHFAVFTPYFRRWEEVNQRTPLAAPRRLTTPPVTGIPLPGPADLCPGPSSPQLIAGGPATGRKALREWVAGPIGDYAEHADRLDSDATSHLSPYLHFGCLSAVQILAAVESAGEGARAFVRQLAWRDFHHQVLAARPDAAWSDYRSRAGHTWRDDPQAVRAWRAGETGFPVVDAGMRQLHAQGWMPGRARLIVAGFLTKSLGVDWRIGARHFLDWLVDADVANNQLNWQWAAGTGTDTRPNRKLNPIRQADRFDPDGTYVRRWLPELAELPGSAVHRPWRANIDHAVYPAPIIECPGM